MSVRVAPEYVLEDETGKFFKCQDCGIVINGHTDLCNKCYVKNGGVLV